VTARERIRQPWDRETAIDPPRFGAAHFGAYQPDQLAAVLGRDPPDGHDCRIGVDDHGAQGVRIYMQHLNLSNPPYTLASMPGRTITMTHADFGRFLDGLAAWWAERKELAHGNGHPNDNRPRIPYVLPDGTEAPIVFDRGGRVPDTVSFQLRGGEIVQIPLSPSYTGPRELPL
jgi:hypothetical protein